MFTITLVTSHYYSCVYSSESGGGGVCVCFCVRVFLHDNSKSNQSRNIKFKHIVVYENISDKFDNGHCHSGTLNFFSIYHNTNYQSFNSTLVQARKLILSMYVHLIIIHKINEYRHA